MFRIATLEHVAINDVLPLKAAPRCAIANVESLWGPRTPATYFRCLHLHSLCGVTLFGPHQGLLSPVRQSLVRLRLLTLHVCNAWQRSRTQNSRRVRENSGPILILLWAKVHENLGQYRKPIVFLNAFAQLSTSRFV